MIIAFLYGIIFSVSDVNERSHFDEEEFIPDYGFKLVIDEKNGEIVDNNNALEQN